MFIPGGDAGSSLLPKIGGGGTTTSSAAGAAGSAAGAAGSSFTGGCGALAFTLGSSGCSFNGSGCVLLLLLCLLKLSCPCDVFLSKTALASLEDRWEINCLASSLL